MSGHVLFTPIKISSRRLRNRIVRSATYEGKPRYNLPAACLAREACSVPVISVGGFRSGIEMEEALQAGSCDLIAVARPFIAEPDFVRRISADLSSRSACCNCNQCAVMCDAGTQTHCYLRGRHERK